MCYKPQHYTISHLFKSDLSEPKNMASFLVWPLPDLLVLISCSWKDDWEKLLYTVVFCNINVLLMYQDSLGKKNLTNREIW